MATYNYQDPTNETNSLSLDIISASVISDAIFVELVPNTPVFRTFIDIIQSQAVSMTEFGFDPVAEPNPKRGFVSITTYPPVYKSKSGEEVFATPRVYPPIVGSTPRE